MGHRSRSPEGAPGPQRDGADADGADSADSVRLRALQVVVGKSGGPGLGRCVRGHRRSRDRRGHELVAEVAKGSFVLARDACGEVHVAISAGMGHEGTQRANYPSEHARLMIRQPTQKMHRVKP